MRILLVEPEAGGHHFVPYAAALARALVEAGQRPTLLTTGDATSHPAMAEFQRMVGVPLPVRLMPSIRPARSGSIPSLLGAQLAYWHAVRVGIAALAPSDRPGTCILLGLDSCDRAIATLGSPCGRLRFAGLTIQAKHHWPTLGIGPGGRHASINRWTFSRVLAHRDCLGIATIDETLVAFEEAAGRQPGRVRHVPDPGEVVRRVARGDARHALGVDSDAPLVLVYGGLDGRKNVAPLFAAARRARSSPLVALVGRIAQEVHALRDAEDGSELTRAGRLIVRDAFVSRDEEALWFGAADIVWVGYRADFLGQSANMPLAASAGVPVIGRRGGLIGRTIEEAGIGRALDPTDAGSVAAAIDSLACARRDADIGDNLARFAATRSHAAHGRAWCEALHAWGAVALAGHGPEGRT
jgi:hypothetical protein